MSQPMMKCGHAAQGTQRLDDGTTIPVCVICGMGDRGSADYKTVDDAPPSLDGRTSRCSYYKPGFKCDCGKDHCPPTRHERHGGGYGAVAPSSASLPFFKHQPEKEYDQHFCGCWGWD